MWKESSFNVRLPIVDGGSLLINTLHRSIVRLPPSVDSRLREAILAGKNISLPKLRPLLDAGILIPSEVDESQLFQQWYKCIASDMASIRCTVALTSRCNLSCAYCFEGGALRDCDQTMSEAVGYSTIKWLKALAEHGKTQKIHIVLYGGEPTIVPRQMLRFVGNARRHLGTQYELTFGMYTNGVAFSNKLVSLFKGPDFIWAQVSLDGPQKTHDTRRHLQNGQGTFERIWKNIETLACRCNVKVRIVINFDKDNHSTIPTLLKQIACSDFSHRVGIAFNPIFNTRLNRAYCATHNFTEAKTHSLWRSLYEETIHLGLKTSFLRMLDKGPCAIHRDNNLYISPNGEVYECIGLLGFGNNMTAKVGEPFSSSVFELRKAWMAKANNWSANCGNCPYLPLCLGGCRFKALCETGSLTGQICHKELIENCEMELIRYLYSS